MHVAQADACTLGCKKTVSIGVPEYLLPYWPYWIHVSLLGKCRRWSCKNGRHHAGGCCISNSLRQASAEARREWSQQGSSRKIPETERNHSDQPAYLAYLLPTQPSATLFLSLRHYLQRYAIFDRFRFSGKCVLCANVCSWVFLVHHFDRRGVTKFSIPVSFFGEGWFRSPTLHLLLIAMSPAQ